jgi:hypothetical protein
MPDMRWPPFPPSYARRPKPNCHRDATVNFDPFASFVAGNALLWGIAVALGSGG